MQNAQFQIQLNPTDGTVSSILNPSDANRMNWCAENTQWGWIYAINRDEVYCCVDDRKRPMRLIAFQESETESRSVYSNDMLEVEVFRSFRTNGNFAERYTVTNLRKQDVFLGQEDFGIEVPFNDKYTNADECMIRRCNTHIWCGHHTAYINALRMGISDCNLGLVLTQGSVDSYSIRHQHIKGESYRGRFILNSGAFHLCSGEQYVMEWELFWHTGNQDFYQQAVKFPSFIEVKTENETVYMGEAINFTAKVQKNAKNISVSCGDKQIDFTENNDNICVNFVPESTGEYPIWIEADGVKTKAEFLVVPPLENIIEKRLEFILKHQRYKNPKSPLDGAFLIYDTEDKNLVFDDAIPDHNACRERIGMALLMTRWLQIHKDAKMQEALDDYLTFLHREFYEDATGEVFNSVGKNPDMVRLYNAPWVASLFAEVYFLTKDTAYLTKILKIFRFYYSGGGSNFYPNGLSLCRTVSAFEDAGWQEERKEILTYFKEHTDNMIAFGTSYPKHEVQYEQTIVTPAATFISEMAAITGEEIYRTEAKKHITILKRFNGHQPSFHLDEIPIRYWDDYWFGKSRIFGDVFPHYWSCLTARSYLDYYRVSGEEEYLKSAERCLRNCLCLFAKDGSASCAYVFPYRIDDAKGGFYDAWANDQDFALYFYLTAEELL